MQFSSRQDRLEHATEVLVKIADYGTSRISTLHGIKFTNPIGTPGYMAPELFSHQGQEISPDKVSTRSAWKCYTIHMYMYVCVCYYVLSLKVDVFAFGMTIYELLAMRPPFDELYRKNPAILHKYIRDGRRPLLSNEVIFSLIQKMTLRSVSIGYNITVHLTSLPVEYSVTVALTGLPIGYSVTVAITGLPIGYSVI